MPPAEKPTTDLLSHLRCYCIYTATPDRQPALCSEPANPAFTWDSAQEFAALFDIPLLFANKETASRVGGAVLPFSAGSNIVCGSGDEVQSEYPDVFADRTPEHEQFVSRIGALMVLFVVLFVLVECIWKK